MDGFRLRSIGRVASELTDREAAPRQGDEGAPEADLVFDADLAQGLGDVAVGMELIVLTWLHRANREVLVTYPRGDTSRPQQGVFTTRSPDRPNPIGLHRVRVLARDGTRVRVAGLEAIDGTPIVDVKPVLDTTADR
ncbi:MAG: tRNA (N6-threonylcarbamoyladenosine(37)-N6)-methyltransferase TrmO [Actinomycetota bacterium]|nr:tRNA (N6-threonylcarbamoyladenosine(37)-N6)-methyltransferase TrmO [Actinomycetota bacterium]